MGDAEQWQELVYLVFCSEISPLPLPSRLSPDSPTHAAAADFLTGLGDLAIITSLRSSEPKNPNPPEKAMKSEVLSVLWSFRVALVVATMYIIIGYGLTLSALITGAVALLLYFIQFIKMQEASSGKFVAGKPFIFLMGYASVVNFVFGLPYLINTTSRFLWMIQIFVSFLSFGLALGYAFSVPEIQASYGCYPKPAGSFFDLGDLGVCPASKLPVPSATKDATCTRLEAEGMFDCDTLPWADTIGSGVLHAARTILAVGLGLYASAAERCYRNLTAIRATKSI